MLDLAWVNGVCVLQAVFPVKDASGRRAGAVLMARDVTPLIRHSRPYHVLAVLGVLLAASVLGLLAGWLLARPEEGAEQVAGPAAWRKAFAGLPRAWLQAVKEVGAK